MHYTSKALLYAKTKSPKMEKWVVALVTTTRKTRPYFQAYPVVVMTDQPLRQRHLVKWSVKLSEFDISYQPWTTIKAHTLVDFVVEYTKLDIDISYEQTTSEESSNGVWLIIVDGFCGEQGSEAEVILRRPEGVEVSYAIKFEFKVTNNWAEYEAFIAGL